MPRSQGQVTIQIYIVFKEILQGSLELIHLSPRKWDANRIAAHVQKTGWQRTATMSQKILHLWHSAEAPTKVSL